MLDLAGIDRVAQVMARTILDEGDQVGIVLDTFRLVRCQFVEQGAKTSHHIDILLLVVPTDVVGLADNARGHYFEQRPGVIFNEQPVANLQAIAVHR
ncbi:hypothetical protein D3C87_1522880 [compost metagenome]